MKYQTGEPYVKHWRPIYIAETNQTARVRFKLPVPPRGQKKHYDFNVVAGWREHGDYGAVSNSVSVVVKNAAEAPYFKLSSPSPQIPLHFVHMERGGRRKNIDIGYSKPFILNLDMADYLNMPDETIGNLDWRRCRVYPNQTPVGPAELLLSNNGGKTWESSESFFKIGRGAGRYLARVKIVFRTIPFHKCYGTNRFSPTHFKLLLHGACDGFYDSCTIDIALHGPTVPKAGRELRSAGQGNLPAKPGNIIPYNIAALQADMRRAQKVLKEINNKPKQSSPTTKTVSSVKVGDIRRARLELRKGNRLLLGN